MCNVPETLVERHNNVIATSKATLLRRQCNVLATLLRRWAIDNFLYMQRSSNLKRHRYNVLETFVQRQNNVTATSKTTLQRRQCDVLATLLRRWAIDNLLYMQRPSNLERRRCNVTETFVQRQNNVAATSKTTLLRRQCDVLATLDIGRIDVAATSLRR